MDFKPPAPFKITRPIFFLGLTSFFTDAASEIVYPLMPVFLTSVLGASALFVGLVEGVAESTASLTKYFFGWWSDRTRRRTPFVIAGYGLANTVRPLVGLTTAPWQVLGLRFTDRIGKGMRTAPRDAWLAGLAAPEARGRVYGFHRAMDHAGAVVGPLLATAFLFYYPGRLRQLFLLSIIPGLAAVLCVLAARWPFTPREPAAPVPLTKEDGPAITPAFKRYLGILFIFTLAGSSDAFLLLKLNASGVDAKMIPLLWAALHVIKSACSVWGGRLADKIGRRPSIILGWTWYAVIYALLAFFDSTAVVVAIFLAYGLYYGLTESAERALAADMAPAAGRGQAFGLFNLIVGLGALPASLLFGFLWKVAGPFTAFMVSAVLALTAAGLMTLWKPLKSELIS